jgi:hypothetical protein
MRSQLLIIKNSEVTDPILLYWAGVFKGFVDIDIDQVIIFVRQIFENHVFDSCRDEIKKMMILGNIGKVVEIVEGFRCGLCRKFENGLLCLTCGHLLHEKCFLEDISLKMMNGKYFCPICRKIDHDVANLNPVARTLIKTQQMAMILENNRNMSICPNCSTICEIEEAMTKCYSCCTTFCVYCLELNNCLCD